MTQSSETASSGRVVVAMTVLGAVGLLVGFLFGMITFGLIGGPLSLSVGNPSGQLLFTLGTYVGLAAVGGLYLSRHGRSLSFVRIRRPTPGDLGVAVATVLALVALAVVLPALIERLGLPLVDHGIADSIDANPTIALVFLPLSVFVVGPAEEFLYRGIIQTRLTAVFDTLSAVGIAALIFAVVHFIAYLDPANVPGTLVTIFLLLLPLGAILGLAYEYSGNLLVPALAHGIYNAITFAMTYVDAVGAV
jgi:membrane protease YdiL (CAAX protease family)